MAKESGELSGRDGPANPRRALETAHPSRDSDGDEAVQRVASFAGRGLAPHIDAAVACVEGYGLIHRKVYPQVPPKVEYSLTPLGQTLKPVIDAMHDWAENARARSSIEAKLTLFGSAVALGFGGLE